MDLEGQETQAEETSGYAMAALLVALGVMAVMMSVAMPVWRQQAKREKEAELVFRGEQYARAIYLYRRKNGGTSPANVDLLVDQRYLRKKYKDPMTEDGEFQIIPMGGLAQPGLGGPAGRAGGVGPGVRGVGPGVRGAGPGAASRGGAQPPPVSSFSSGAPGQFATGGIQGVQSKSPEASLRVYRGATHYNQWQFLPPIMPQPGGPGQQTPGMGPGRGGRGPGRGGPGGPGSGTGGGRGPGGRGVGPGGRGMPPPGPGGGPGSNPFGRPPGGRGVSH